MVQEALSRYLVSAAVQQVLEAEPLRNLSITTTTRHHQQHVQPNVHQRNRSEV